MAYFIEQEENLGHIACMDFEKEFPDYMFLSTPVCTMPLRWKTALFSHDKLKF